MDDIKIWNPYSGKIETENVYGGWGVSLLYGSRPFLFMADQFLAGKSFSKFYGKLQSSKLSRRKIKPFIEHFEINMDEFEDSDFNNFNEFFIRRFKEGARPFSVKSSELPAFAEARYFGFENVTSNTQLPVKGAYLRPQQLLGETKWTEKFEGGPVLVARLCPVDYHRFHYPDAGVTKDQFSVNGKLHSVNPAALQAKEDIFATNERKVSILATENFGHLAYVEVGAMCVGRIVQSHHFEEFKRGDEKGYFLFGGSTVIVLGEPNRWKIRGDILDHSKKGIETYVQLGDVIASKKGLPPRV